jgi:hypothetical protein
VAEADGSCLLVDLAAVDRAFRILLDAFVESTGQSVVSISKDLYWELPSRQMYDPLNLPEDFALGSLEHDLERVEQIVDDPTLAVRNGLQWLGALLRAVGDPELASFRNEFRTT